MNTDFMKGVIVPILTPIDENEWIDEIKMREQVDFVINGGVSGILAFGSNGEFYVIEEDEMEIGMGIHGEPGIRRGKLEPADQIVDEMLEKIVADLPYENGDEVAVLVNGLGATPLDEQYIVTRRINQVLEEKGISVYKYYVGEYATAIEMAGFSISLLKLDDELKEYIDHPVDTPFFKQV